MFYEHRVFHVQVIYLLTKWILLYYCFISSSSSFWFRYWYLQALQTKSRQLNQSVTITLSAYEEPDAIIFLMKHFLFLFTFMKYILI